MITRANLGLTRDEFKVLMEVLFETHLMQVSVKIKRLKDEKTISSLTAARDRVLSGSVQMDATAPVSRSLELSVLDPQQKLRFGAVNPVGGTVHATRLLVVHYQVYLPGFEKWASIPIFWGPLSGFTRAGPEVSIEGKGKESLMLAPHYATFGYTIPKRTRIDDAIRKVARRMGERRFAIPDLGHHRLQRPRAVHARAEPWLIITDKSKVEGFKAKVTKGKGKGKHTDNRAAIGLINTIPGHHTAFYDGLGRLCVRRLNRPVRFAFHDDKHLLSQPEVTYDLDQFRNSVWVIGGKPKGKKKRVTAHAFLPDANPMSPKKMRRNGEKASGFLSEWVNADNAKTHKKAKDLATKYLKHLSTEGVDVSFDCMPLPLLEEHDTVKLVSAENHIEFPIHSMTIPLTSSESMSINRHKRVRVKKHHKSPHHHHHHHAHHRHGHHHPPHHHHHHHPGGHHHHHHHPGGHHHHPGHHHHGHGGGGHHHGHHGHGGGRHGHHHHRH